MNNKMILLIEDDYLVQTIHKSMLVKLGYDVDAVDNAKKAIEYAKSKHYQLIFVDIGLPDISGYEVLKILFDYYRDITCAPALIALTGFSGEKETQACLRAGACLVVNKPIVLNALRKVLAKYAPIAENSCVKSEKRADKNSNT